MMSKFEIRKASQDDIPILLDFITALAEYEKLKHAVVVTPEALRSSLFCDHPVAYARIGEWLEDGKRTPVAFAIYFYNYSTFLGKAGLYLEDLFVNPAYRGKGVGKAMLQDLARIAQEKGCERLEWSVLDWNEPAIRFYKKIGAVSQSEWTVYRLNREKIALLAK